MTSRPSWAGWLNEPVGEDVGRWLFGGVAVAMLLFGWKTYASAPVELLTAPGAWVLHSLMVAVVVALVVGPRRWALLIVALLAVRATVSNHVQAEPLLWFPAAEWPLFIVLPACGVVLRKGVDVRGAFQVTALAGLGFAGLHKLNTDYFDPVVTCNRLSGRLSEWWGLPPETHAWVTPAVVVAFELGAPVLLVVAPRVGVVFALLLLGHFTLIGATALSLTLAVCVLAFLDADDLRTLRHPSGLLAAGAAMAASWWLYQGPWSWGQYGFSHAVFGVLLVGASWRLARQGLGRWTLPRHPFVRTLAVLWGLNGLMPYTGLKFQYSFAMLSNLRVDDDRHNSLLFPSNVRLTSSDPFVHIRQAWYVDARGRMLKGVVQPGLYAPFELLRHAAAARDASETLRFRGTYAGLEIKETDLEGLPRALLFQKSLTRGAPQECVH